MNICEQFYILSDIIKVKLFILIPILYIRLTIAGDPRNYASKHFVFKPRKLASTNLNVFTVIEVLLRLNNVIISQI